MKNGEYGDGTSREERAVARGGKDYEEACGYLATMRKSICNAFKENNPGDTSSLRYKNDCYYELDAEEDAARQAYALIGASTCAALVAAIVF